jgi:hypothetical protein
LASRRIDLHGECDARIADFTKFKIGGFCLKNKTFGRQLCRDIEGAGTELSAELKAEKPNR